ncbi:hypothetical protein NP493_726g01066 [Ridgeia piscesae]|uniref:Uncharacterized protein n=1 Tax=Ridgeia piscesae TaxID=27915 RepID=A0AAD9KQ12_RIDPI|nr:hypothetical protein NP493_726g01066 [Ridgeia piscesae]
MVAWPIPANFSRAIERTSVNNAATCTTLYRTLGEITITVPIRTNATVGVWLFANTKRGVLLNAVKLPAPVDATPLTMVQLRAMDGSVGRGCPRVAGFSRPNDVSLCRGRYAH